LLAAGVNAEWDDIVRDLDRVEQIAVEQDRKHFVLRPQAPGCAAGVFQAVGVALPPLVRQLPSVTPPPASPPLAPSAAAGDRGVVPRRPEFSRFLLIVNNLQIRGVQVESNLSARRSETGMPRSARRSSTSRKLSVYRRYNHTACWMITSGKR
jgi:hypothetical protein